MKNKEQQNLEQYVDAIEKQIKETIDGKITEINHITNTVFFGEMGQYDERDGFALTIIMEDDDKTEFTEWFSKPTVKGYQQSKLKQFKDAYKTVPKIDLKVKCCIDENGFYKVKL